MRKDPLVLISPGKSGPLILGGPGKVTGDLKQKCLARTDLNRNDRFQVFILKAKFGHLVTWRMVNWVQVSLGILETEFPSYSICATLARAFKISPILSCLPAENRNSLKALARTWCMDLDASLQFISSSFKLNLLFNFHLITNW